MPESHPPEALPSDAETMPVGQRFFDNIHLLLVLGVIVVGVLYAGWGLWEILTLPPATLP